MTDALSKLMLYLGGSADVWLNEFDPHNKYVAPKPAAVAAAQEKPATRLQRTPFGSAPYEERPAPPAEDDRGEATYLLEGYRVRASEWVATARTAAQHHHGDNLLDWWQGYRGTRSTIYRLHDTHRVSLAALSKELVDRAEAEGASPELVALARGRKAQRVNGHGPVSPDDALRAG
jgi:hypothetical protein